MLGTLLTLTLTLVHAAPAASRQVRDSSLTEREQVVHLLSRFTNGVRAVDVERVLEIGIDSWIDQQLAGGPSGPLTLSTRLEELDTLRMSPSEAYLHTFMALPENATRKDRIERDQRRRLLKRELLESIALRSIYSDQQLQDVLCDFWRNHFNVSYTKGYPADIYISDYERTVIQAHVVGSFEAMLSASAHHPAMMHYLDNALSRRPPSSSKLSEIANRVRRETGSKERGEEAAEIAAERGLNENYARELLELHTLGVDRTYKQKDVIAVAEALTGWGLARGAEEGMGFAFNSDHHIESDKKFLGYVLRRDKKSGTAQGERILEIIARHDDTADFIAMKLVRYFVNDVPPPRLVKDVAKTFKKKNASIPEMVKTILESEEFWSRENYQSKFKTPREFLDSALRVTGARLDSPASYSKVLSSMGQLTYHCDDPTGWYDTADAWLDPGVMAKRWEVALNLTSGRLEGLEVPDSFYGTISTSTTPLSWMRQMVAKVLPGGASTRTLAMLHEVVRQNMGADMLPEATELGPMVVGLLLGSPEFQRQ